MLGVVAGLPLVGYALGPADDPQRHFSNDQMVGIWAGCGCTGELAGRTAGQDPRRGNLPIGMTDGLSHAPRPTGRNASPGRGTRTAKTGSTSHAERDPHASVAVGLRGRALTGSRLQAAAGQGKGIGRTVIYCGAAAAADVASEDACALRRSGRDGPHCACGRSAAGRPLYTLIFSL